MIFPVRNLAKYGVITDVDAYNIPTEAWSMAVNARFQGGSVLRAPVFRTATASLTYSSPRFVSSTTPATGYDSVVLGYLNGAVTTYKSAVETDISISGYTPSDAEAPYTSCHLGGVFYVNRSDRVPWYMLTSDLILSTLPNWTSTWRAQLLRSCSSALCAFGITKAGVSYPTMIKTSEFAVANSVPTTWDDTDPTTNATENILAEMEGPITDAQTFGEIMIVYGTNEAWTMVMDRSAEVWVYHKLFGDAGAIAANCVVEVNKKHYVFGLNDIWMHDGTEKASICDERTRHFIFGSINILKAYHCFVVYDHNRKEIRFNYVSGDDYVAFSGAEGCNRSAVFNVVNNTWAFDDLPFIFGGARANMDTIQTYASTTATYATVGGTYLDQEDSLKKTLVMVGDANTAHGLSESLYAVDLQGPGSSIAFGVDTNATKGVTLEHDGIDLDEVGANLPGYKTVNSIYPQARLEVSAEPLTFRFGSADYFNADVAYSDPQTYDGNTLYKLDFRAAGRYLKMKVTHDDYHYINFSGFDVDVDVLGAR